MHQFIFNVLKTFGFASTKEEGTITLFCFYANNQGYSPKGVI